MKPTAVNELESLRFFGKVSASVSHEIKNVFAVINEGAGLLSDLTLMAEKGMPIDPGRLKRVADSIQGQVRRGDIIVKNMNQLAHSTDEGVRQIEVQQLLELTTALATRMADMKQVRLETGPCDDVTTAMEPFAFIRLVYSAISHALESMAPQATLTLSVRGDEGGTVVLSPPTPGITLTADESLVELATQSGVTVTQNNQDGNIELSLGSAAEQ